MRRLFSLQLVQISFLHCLPRTFTKRIIFNNIVRSTHPLIYSYTFTCIQTQKERARNTVACILYMMVTHSNEWFYKSSKSTLANYQQMRTHLSVSFRVMWLCTWAFDPLFCFLFLLTSFCWKIKIYYCLWLLFALEEEAENEKNLSKWRTIQIAFKKI